MSGIDGGPVLKRRGGSEVGSRWCKVEMKGAQVVIEVVDRSKLQKTNQLFRSSFLIWIFRNTKHAMPRRYDRCWYGQAQRPFTTMVVIDRNRRIDVIAAFCTHAGCGCGERSGWETAKTESPA